MRNKELKEVIYNNIYQNASEGYVLTPSELACEMVSTLPNEVFSSDKTTFLDPICKSGTFLFEIAERLYNEGHSINNIQKRIYTIDGNSHSLNVANAYIKRILNREGGYFQIDFKSDFSETFFNILCNVVSDGKFKTFIEFIDTILIDKNKSYLMAELKKSISDFISQYEKVSKLESKLFGEVFTPRQLIDEMLDTLPDEVWKNKDLKWLDPAVGIGNFPAAILDRLMSGLEEVIPNEDKRKKWILEEMLYMCDISIKNLFLLYKLFDSNNEFKLNVYRGSFLDEGFDEHMTKFWGLEGFDVIVGNPPYNENNSNNDDKLYFKFIKKSFNLLFDNRFLLYVLPDDSINYIINYEKYNVLLLNANNIVNRFFKGVGTKILYFLSSKRIDKYQKTLFIDKNREELINLNDKCLVLMNIKDTLIVDKILKKSRDRYEVKNAKYNGNNFRIRFNSIKETSFSLRGINFICVDEKLLNKHSLDRVDFDANLFKYGVIDHSTDRIEFNADSNFDNDKKRICINAIGEMKACYDEFGQLLLTDSCVYIEPKENENPDNYLELLNNSKLVKFLQRIITHNTKNKFKSLNYLPYLDMSIKWSNDDIYKHFNLTDEEIDLIEKTIKD